MNHLDYFCANAVWWPKDGVAYVYFVDYTPRLKPKEIQHKLPGGRAEPNEKLEDTARRETKEELGLSIKRRFPLHELMRVGRNGHMKIGYLTFRGGCRGTLRKGSAVETNSTISEPYEITVGEAQEKIFRKKHNMFYKHYIDKVAKEMLKRGLKLDKPTSDAQSK